MVGDYSSVPSDTISFLCTALSLLNVEALKGMMKGLAQSIYLKYGLHTPEIPQQHIFNITGPACLPAGLMVLLVTTTRRAQCAERAKSEESVILLGSPSDGRHGMPPRKETCTIPCLHIYVLLSSVAVLLVRRYVLGHRLRSMSSVILILNSGVADHGL